MNGLTINDMGIFCPPFDKQTVRDAHPTSFWPANAIRCAEGFLAGMSGNDEAVARPTGFRKLF